MIDQFKTFEQSMTEQLSAMRKTLGLGDIAPAPVSAKTKKSKKPKAEEPSDSAEPKEPKAPNAWMTLIANTVTDMKSNGWTEWTDVDGKLWNGSRPQTVTDAKGQKVSDHVYDGGEHNGKAPSHALGGMKRASFLKGQNDPAAAAKSKAYRDGLAEKRSASSVGSAEKDAPVADEPKKKAGRPRKPKAAEAAAPEAEAPSAEAEFTEVEATPAATPVKAKKVVMAPKKAAKKVDLSFFPWEHAGKTYITNDRGDVIEPEEGVWVGRFNGTTIDESVEEPSDLDGVTMRE